MRVLVTGGAGYIGSHAVKLLLEKNHQVIVIDNLSRGFKQAITTLQKKYGKGNLHFYQADLRNYPVLDKIIENENPKAVMHFAALCLVNESMEKPEIYFENNVYGSLNLLKSMVKNNINYLIFSSTSAVYGTNHYLPIDEKHPTYPGSPYGESKLITEKMINWFNNIYNLKYVIFRYFNVTGASSDGLIGDSKKPSSLLVQNAVRGALNIEPFRLTCPRVDTPDHTPIRDYVNVEDLVNAHYLALNYLSEGKSSNIFNLGTSKGFSVLEIIKQVKKMTGVNFPVGKARARSGEDTKLYSNINKAKKLLGWEPKRKIVDSVKSLVKWYRSHPNGWKN